MRSWRRSTPSAGGEIIQIIDPEHLTQQDVLAIAGDNKPIIRMPRPVVFALGKLSEYPLGAIGRASPIGVYRLKSALAQLHFESERAKSLLGSGPPRRGLRGHPPRDVTRRFVARVGGSRG